MRTPNGKWMSAPPVGLWAPPVPFGNQWPPCTDWYPGSSLTRWWGRGGSGFACRLELGGCWFSAPPAAHAASIDGCRSASPWTARTPRSERVRREVKSTRDAVIDWYVLACGGFTCLGWIHDDSGDKIQEDVIAVGPHSCVVECHLKLVHGFQQQTLGLVVQVFKRCFLFEETTGLLKCIEIFLYLQHATMWRITRRNTTSDLSMWSDCSSETVCIVLTWSTDMRFIFFLLVVN